jgi:hypothetical protein
MSIRWIPALVCFACVAGLFAAPPAAASAELNPGQVFPELVLPSLDGPERSIADFRGRKIALHVFASW